MRTCLLLIVAVAACGFAPVPPPRPTRVPDMARLSGSWLMQRYQDGERDMSNGRQLRVVIDKEKWAFHITEGKAAERPGSSYLMTVDPKAEPPLFVWLGRDRKRQYIGSYQLKGDVLSVVFRSAPEGPEAPQRPTNFEKAASGSYLLVLKRQSDKPEAAKAEGA